MSAEDFKKIPGNPIWVSQQGYNAFLNNNHLENHCVICQGLATTDNGRFVRQWQEVSFSKIGYYFSSLETAATSHRKWFPIDKGGGFRKWYGNNLYVVNWGNNGRDIKENIVRNILI